MSRIQQYFHRHPNFLKAFVLGYVVFAGCFVFPFDSERFPMDWMKAYLVIASYGIIGWGFAAAYGAHKEKFVYVAGLLLTPVGMACRYALEYGEVSNTWNFTPLNIVSYIVIIPIFTAIAYHFSAKKLEKERGC